MPSIRSPEDAPDVMSAIKYLFNNRLYTDFSFLSRDGRERHHVHRLIVAIHSPVLAELLYPDKNESKSILEPVDFIQVKYDDNLALRNLISFLYSEDLVLETISDIRQTKAIADRYEMRQLGEICKEEFTNVPASIVDVLIILETARDFRNEQKESECLRLISENQQDIFTSHQFLGLPFRRVLNIFENIKEMRRMTEGSFLRLAIRWLDTNGSANGKDLLMEKIDVTCLPLDEYLDLLEEFPDFFSNIEMSYAIKEIRTRCVKQEITKPKTAIIPKKEYQNRETNTEKCIKEEELLADVNFFKNELHSEIEKREDLEKKNGILVIEMESVNLENERKDMKIKDLEGTVKKLQERKESTPSMSSSTNASYDNKQKVLSIQILNRDDGVNVFEFEKRARITVQEGTTVRSLQTAVCSVLKKGLLGTIAEKKGSYSESDVDLSYEGVYFMLRSLQQLDETMCPIRYVEVLKAALHFQLKDVAAQCIKKINGIVDYDPVFLDGLRTLSYLKDKCRGLNGLSGLIDKYTALLLSEPLRVILHPNFTKCSVDLIIQLLQQQELKVKDESQLLLVIIAWLESQKESRRLLRTTVLKNLAFQNVSTADFRYAIMHYPNFFDEKEQKLVLAYRNAVGTEVKFFRDNLPEWYSTKTRKHI